MVDFVKVIDASFASLKKSKDVFIFFGTIVVIQIILMSLVVGITGGFSMLSQLHDQKKSFDVYLQEEVAKTDSKVDDLIPIVGGRAYNDRFMAYMSKTEFVTKAKDWVLAPFNLISYALLVLITIILAFVGNASIYYYISGGASRSQSFIGFCSEYILLLIATLCLMLLIPTLFFVIPIMIVVMAQLHWAIIVIIVILSIIALIWSLLYFSASCVFVIPSLATNRLGVSAAFKDSFSLAKGRMGRIFMVVLIGVGINSIVSSVIYNPFASAVGDVLMPNNIAGAIVGGILLLVFLFAKIIATVFVSLFYYHSYAAFAAEVKKNG